MTINRTSNAPSHSSPSSQATFAGGRRLFLLLLALAALVPAAAILFRGHLPLSSGDVRGLFPYHSEPLAALEEAEVVFGDSLVDSFILPLPNTLDDETKERLSAIEEELAGISGVLTVVNPVNGFSRFAPPITLLSQPLLPKSRPSESHSPESSTSELRQPNQENRQWGRFLLEIDGALTDDERHSVDAQLTNLAQREGALRAGPFSASEGATRALERESKTFAPLCFAILVVLLLFLTGSAIATAQLMAAPTITLLWVSLLLVLTDTKLSAVSQLVPPLLLAIGASYSVFVGMRVISHRGEGRIQGLSAGLTLAAVTTIIGFLSLVFLHTRAVTQFALILGAGSGASAVLALLLTPRILHHFPGATVRARSRVERWSRLRPPTLRRTTVAGALLLCVALSAGAFRIHVNTTPLHFLPPEDRASIQRAETLFPGSHVLSGVFTFQAPLSEADLSLLRDASRSLAKAPGVVRTVSAADFSEWWQRLPQDIRPESSLEFGPPSMTNEARTHSRILIETDLEGNALLHLAGEAEKTLHEAVRGRPEIKFALSSRELVIAQHSRTLALGLIESLTSALLLVALLLLILFRSVTLAALGLFANALPVLAIFGGIGFLAPEINLGAAMVAATALGMVSDNTFHLLCTWRDLKEGDLSNALALSFAPVLVTVLVVVLGFSPTLLSPILPVRQFGLLLGAALLSGLAMNLLVLPALWRGKKGG